MKKHENYPRRIPGNIALAVGSQGKLRYRRRPTRRAPIRPATVFIPQTPNETPEHHFPLQRISSRSTQSRFINRYNSREILVLVDGSCINNGSKDGDAKPPAGGCSFTYKGPGSSSQDTIAFPFTEGGPTGSGMVGFPLEKRGPGGERCDATSNRAKLRAVIAALEFRAWEEEGWRRIVIATDLEYVVDGATRYLPQWVRRRWRTTKHKSVANRDLWEELNGVIENLQKMGTSVSFWLLLPRSLAKETSMLVRETKNAAKEAALEHTDAAAAEFTRLRGIMV